MKKVISLFLSLVMMFSVASMSTIAHAKEYNTKSKAIQIESTGISKQWDFVYSKYDSTAIVWFMFTPKTEGLHEIHVGSASSNFATTIEVIKDDVSVASKSFVCQTPCALSYSMKSGTKYAIKITSQIWNQMGVNDGDKTRFSIRIDGHKHVWELDPTFSSSVDDICVYRCPICGNVKYENIPAKISWSGGARYKYNGKAHAPTFTPKDSWGNVIKDDGGKSYSAKIYSTNEKTAVKPSTIKKVGAYHCVVKMKYPYKGTFTYDYVIYPANTVTIKKVAAGSKKLTVKWAKQKGISGYKIQYSPNKNFSKNVGEVYVKGASKTKATIKNLNSKKKYYVRICVYKSVKNYQKKTVRVCGAWSKTASIKVK